MANRATMQLQSRICTLQIWSTTALSADGTLVVSDSAGRVLGIRDGAIAWEVQRAGDGQGNSLSDAVALGPDGTITWGRMPGNSTQFVDSIAEHPWTPPTSRAIVGPPNNTMELSGRRS